MSVATAPGFFDENAQGNLAVPSVIDSGSTDKLPSNVQAYYAQIAFDKVTSRIQARDHVNLSISPAHIIAELRRDN